MKIPPSELIDRMSILKLKIEKVEDSLIKENLKKEFLECEKSIKEFKSVGMEIKKEWFNQLYKINDRQWDLESAMNNARKQGLSLEEVGRICIEIRESNKRRIALKNQISEKIGEGFRDIEMN